MNALQYLNRYLFKYKNQLLLGILFIISANILKIYPLKYLGKSIDLIAEALLNYQNNKIPLENYKSKLLLYSGLLLGLPLLGGLLTFLMRQTIIVTSRKIEFDLKNDIYKQYQILPLSFYKKNKIGDLMNRISEDVTHVRMYLGPGIMYFINMIFAIIIILYYMILISPKLTFLAFIPLPLLSISIYFISKSMNKKSLEIQKSQSKLSTLSQEFFSGIRVIKAFAIEKRLSDLFNQESKEYKNANLKLVRINSLFFPMMILFIGLSNLIALYFGGTLFIEGKIKLGQIVEFFTYINLLIWPFTSIGWVISIVQRAAASQKRINDFLYEKSEFTNPSNQNIILKGAIEFKNIDFIYEDTQIRALHNFNLKINAGETIAIIGETGSGKSTLAQLTNLLLQTNKGEILLDGVPINKINPYRIREQIGYVPQDSFLFSDSIENNIKFGKSNATENEIYKASKNACIYNNITQFDQGFKTVVGERGVTLSGGQKQRISIARALIKKPIIYIFDDCLSAVDTATEKEIFKNIQKETQNTTTLFITHRLSSIKYADKVALLKNGELIDFGTPTDLKSNSKEYQKLIKLYNSKK